MQCLGKGCLAQLQIQQDLKQIWVLILCLMIESLKFKKNTELKKPTELPGLLCR